MYQVDLLVGMLGEQAVIGALSACAIIFAILAVKVKDMVYAAIYLGLLGISIAGLFAVLGFGYVATFHLLVYVGAAVTFIVFSVVMMREIPYVSARSIPIGVISGVLVAALVYYLFVPAAIPKGDIPGMRELADTIVTKYWFPLLILAIALATVIIEGIMIARGERSR